MVYFMSFKNDFVWGGASASYQIEGGAYADDKGLSVWDTFCKQSGKILDGSSGDIACDHYHLYEKDVSLMKEIGYKAYRFSTSWPRIIPNGTGNVSEKGLDFYDRLVNCLLEAEITPYITLYHWDMPYALFQRGGWLNPDSPKWFADYAEQVVSRLGDRVKNFITFNEPQCFIGLSYVSTEHAPGLAFSVKDTLQMAHNTMLAHGQAVQVMRSSRSDLQIGYAPTCSAHYPATESKEDIDAARMAFFDTTDNWSWDASLWSDPVMLGKYPEKFLKMYESFLPEIKADDLKCIHQPLDFYGQNIYNGREVKSDGSGGYIFTERKPGFPVTAVKWPVTPKALYWGPKFLYERYQKPIYITENGLSCQDVVSLDGKVHDPQRIDFLARYLAEYKRAAADGVDLKGYFHWCVTDNFEWAKGYTDRFGMIYCDFDTQDRILKDSAYWYRNVIQSNGENI